ncbi:hypothetical protein ACU635_13695 [[Actinomadura] parvosata]|uniref:hypothetical protein n=1 Tax=[Actinomadura] parvosata TaxID=1955412 RepID=UPI00406CADEE
MTIQEAAQRSGLSAHTLRRMGQHTADERRRMLELHRERVRARIAQLGQDLEVLDYKIDNYRRGQA